MSSSTDNAYKVDFRKLALLLLPTALRKPALYHWLYWLVLPLVTIYRSFYQRRKNNLFFAKYDSGKGNIERMLNIYFFGEYNSANPQIVLANTENQPVEYIPQYVTTTAGTNSAFVGITYIDAPKQSISLEVKAPSAIYTNKYNQLYQLVSTYLLPGIGFKITQKQ